MPTMPLLPENLKKQTKLAFVTPWYGHDYGGAEVFTRGLAEHLYLRGYNVEVLTTCCKDPFADWSTSYYAPGIYNINGVVVRRFAPDRRDVNRFLQLNSRIAAKEEISREEESAFLANSINSSALYEHIKANKGDHYLFFVPYLYGTTYFGAQIVPEKSFIFPCLHDEPHARLKSFKSIFNEIKGILCLSHPEMRLVRSLYGVNSSKTHYIGCSVETNIIGKPEEFRIKQQLPIDFFLYLGKKDRGKNLQQLIAYFQKFVYQTNFPLRLLMIGPGDLRWVTPHWDKELILDLGVVEGQQDKYDALSAAIALCLPSQNESFSIVIMESWLQNRPVVVNYFCDVTRDHCLAANGGLYYRDYWEFYECLKLLYSDKELGQQLGKQGHQYVLKNFTWQATINRFVSALTQVL